MLIATCPSCPRESLAIRTKLIFPVPKRVSPRLKESNGRPKHATRSNMSKFGSSSLQECKNKKIIMERISSLNQQRNSSFALDSLSNRIIESRPGSSKLDLGEGRCSKLHSYQALPSSSIPCPTYVADI